MVLAGAFQSPLFSIVVATFNYGVYLPRALESVLGQEGDDFETLVVDDGSADGTPAIVQRYAPRVRYFRQEHAGTFIACRTGARVARSRFILFLDADDRLMPGALSALRDAIAKHPEARLVLAGTCSVAENGRRSLRPAPELADSPIENFARFVDGSLRAGLAGGVVERGLLLPFDRDSFDYPHGTDRAILGYALLHSSIKIDFTTLEVYDHPGRLRDNIASIDRSGAGLADLLFDPALLPPAAMCYRRRFAALLEASRGRAYFRAGWHSKAWRSYLAAVRQAPVLVARRGTIRRAAASLIKDLCRVPEGPVRRLRGHWLMGHHRQLWNNPFDFLRQCTQEKAPVVRLRLSRRTYLLCEPADMRHILLSRPESYHKTGIQRAFSLLAGGMIGKEGAQHREQRRVVQPNFQKRAMDDLAGLVRTHVDRQIEGLRGCAEIDALSVSKRLCADLAAQVVFGCEQSAKTDRLIYLVQHAHQSAAAEFRRQVRWPKIVSTRRRRRYAALIRELDEWLEPFIARRAQQPGDDMLSVILHSAAPPGRPTHLRERVTMLFLAALDPVANTLAWGLRLLADHPAIQDRIAAEVDSTGTVSGGAMTEMSALPCTANVLNETLRLYPNEWLLTRRAAADDRLPSGVRIRRGEEVMISPYVVQRDAQFFPDPDRFDPERFAVPPAWPAMAFIPFGAGPRICLGEFYARLVMTIALAKFLTCWRVEPMGPLPPLETGNLFSSQPRGGRLPVRLRERA